MKNTIKKLNFVLSYTKNGKHFATTQQCCTLSNLYGAFREKDKFLGDLDIIHYCDSKKKAEELSRQWNESYKQNGTLQTFEE